jgi:hypothetical protein
LVESKELKFTDHIKNLKGEIKDISLGGLKIFSSYYLPKDCKLLLFFKLPNGIDITTSSIVRHSRGSGLNGYDIGVEFITLPNESKNYLQEYINTKLKTEEIVKKVQNS